MTREHRICILPIKFDAESNGCIAIAISTVDDGVLALVGAFLSWLLQVIQLNFSVEFNIIWLYVSSLY